MATATALKFDNLNVLNSKVVKKSEIDKPLAIPYREYFGEMYITPEQMRSRIELAEEIEDVMFYLFAYWIIAEEAEMSIEELKRDTVDKLTYVIAKRTTLDPYLEKHINDVVNEVVDVTEKHRKQKEQEDSDEESDVEELLDEDSKETSKEPDYWTSKDRAILISENEANAFDNYIEYKEAKARGKTKKTWVTEGDDKVRISHWLEAEKTIDIDGLFLVGDSYMRFPKDAEYDPNPREVVNCRCICEYK